MPEPIVTICLDGPPRGKGRPRTRIVGNFATVYTDGMTRAYEARLKEAGIAAMKGGAPTTGPLSVKVVAYLPIPKSWSMMARKLAAAGTTLPTSGIDLDNIIKMLDGLNYHPPRFKGDKERRPIIWHNDAQIVTLQAIKLYSLRPRLEITVWKWDQ